MGFNWFRKMILIRRGLWHQGTRFDDLKRSLPDFCSSKDIAVLNARHLRDGNILLLTYFCVAFFLCCLFFFFSNNQSIRSLNCLLLISAIMCRSCAASHQNYSLEDSPDTVFPGLWVVPFVDKPVREKDYE